MMMIGRAVILAIMRRRLILLLLLSAQALSWGLLEGGHAAAAEIFDGGDPNCISVIIPCYKDGDTVGAAADSVISAGRFLHSAVAANATDATPPDIEILLVDDKSPDRECEVAFWQELAKHDSAVSASVTDGKNLDELQELHPEAVRTLQPQDPFSNLLDFGTRQSAYACRSSQDGGAPGGSIRLVLVVIDGETERKRFERAPMITPPLRNKAGALLGHGHARNRGVRASAGSILMFLDADDDWQPEHMWRLWRPLAHNESFAWSRSRMGFFFGERKEQDGGDGQMHPYWAHMSEKVLFLNVAVRRATFHLIGGIFEGFREGEDELFWRLLKMCCYGYFAAHDAPPSARYIAYEGNHLDSERGKYTRAPLEGKSFEKRRDSEEAKVMSNGAHQALVELRMRLEVLLHLASDQKSSSSSSGGQIANKTPYPWLDLAGAFYRLGSSLSDHGHTELVKQSFQASIRARPSAMAFRDLSVLYNQEQKPWMAAAALESALALDDQCRIIYASLQRQKNVTVAAVFYYATRSASLSPRDRASILLERANVVAQYAGSLTKRILETLWHSLDDPAAPGGMKAGCIPLRPEDCIADEVRAPEHKREAFEYILQATSLALQAAVYEASVGSYTPDCAGTYANIYTTASFEAEERLFGGKGGGKQMEGILPYSGGSLDGFVDPRLLREFELTAPRDNAETLLKAYSRMGEIWETRNETKAISYYEAAVRAYPHHKSRGQLLYNIGSIYLRGGDAEAALKYLDAAVSANGPGGADSDAIMDLATAIREVRGPKDAVPVYLQAIEASRGQNANAMYNLATTFLRMSDVDSALEWHRKAVQINPQLAEGSLLQKIQDAQAAQAKKHEHQDL